MRYERRDAEHNHRSFVPDNGLFFATRPAMLGLMGFSDSLPCMLFIDIISLFINWANKDACLLSCDLLAILNKKYESLIHSEDVCCFTHFSQGLLSCHYSVNGPKKPSQYVLVVM